MDYRTISSVDPKVSATGSNPFIALTLDGEQGKWQTHNPAFYVFVLYAYQNKLSIKFTYPKGAAEVTNLQPNLTNSVNMLSALGPTLARFFDSTGESHKNDPPSTGKRISLGWTYGPPRLTLKAKHIYDATLVKEKQRFEAFLEGSVPNSQEAVNTAKECAKAGVSAAGLSSIVLCPVAAWPTFSKAFAACIKIRAASVTASKIVVSTSCGGLNLSLWLSEVKRVSLVDILFKVKLIWFP